MKRRIQLCLFACLGACGSANYTGLMCDKFKAALGDSYRGYTCETYPTTLDAVGTVYLPDKPDDPASKSNFYCSSDLCLGLDAASPDLTLGGFAAVGANGGPVTLNEKETREFVVKFLLPSILEDINVNATASDSSVTTVDLQFDQAVPRLLQRPKATTWFGSQTADEKLKSSYNAGKLIVVVGDVVVSSMEVKVCVDSKLAAGIDASLSGAPAAVLGKGADLGVSIARSTAGCYTLNVTKPVVVAVLAKHQPTSGGLGLPPERFADWIAAKVEHPDRRPSRAHP